MGEDRHQRVDLEQGNSGRTMACCRAVGRVWFGQAMQHRRAVELRSSMGKGGTVLACGGPAMVEGATTVGHCGPGAEELQVRMEPRGTRAHEGEKGEAMGEWLDIVARHRRKAERERGGKMRGSTACGGEEARRSHG